MTDNVKKEITQLRSSGIGYGRISRQLGIPLSTVKSYCIRNNVPSKARGQVCLQCGHAIEPRQTSNRKRFCSDGCRIRWWNHHTHLMKANAVCVHCGKKFHGRSGRKYCSHWCYIAERFGEKGDAENVTA